MEADVSHTATRELFLQAWGNFPSGVSVVTFYRDDGAVHGLTANAVCSVSIDPMLILVCIDHQARSFPMLEKSERFLMNFLAERQTEEADFFARSDTSEEPPFSFQKSGFGYPILEGCAAYMDCAVFDKHTAGDHTIFLGKVDEIEVSAKEPLVYCSGEYAQLVRP